MSLAKASAQSETEFRASSSNLSDWSNEIEWLRREEGLSTERASAGDRPVQTAVYALLLNHTTELYGFHGVVSHQKGAAGGFLFDPRNVLMTAGSEVPQVHLQALERQISSRAVRCIC